jgi:hypothetical protein
MFKRDTSYTSDIPWTIKEMFMCRGIQNLFWATLKKIKEISQYNGSYGRHLDRGEKYA